MLITAQRENDNLSRENKMLAKKLNELIDDQNKMEVSDTYDGCYHYNM